MLQSSSRATVYGTTLITFCVGTAFCEGNPAATVAYAVHRLQQTATTFRSVTAVNAIQQHHPRMYYNSYSRRPRSLSRTRALSRLVLPMPGTIHYQFSLFPYPNHWHQQSTSSGVTSQPQYDVLDPIHQHAPK